MLEQLAPWSLPPHPIPQPLFPSFSSLSLPLSPQSLLPAVWPTSAGADTKNILAALKVGGGVGEGCRGLLRSQMCTLGPGTHSALTACEPLVLPDTLQPPALRGFLVLPQHSDPASRPSHYWHPLLGMPPSNQSSFSNAARPGQTALRRGARYRRLQSTGLGWEGGTRGQRGPPCHPA